MGGLFFLDFIYLILLRGRKISMCGFLSCTPHQVPCPQTQNVPWLGIKLVPLALNALSHTSWGFRCIFLIMLQQFLFFFLPFLLLCTVHTVHIPSSIPLPHFSSYPWVIHKSSLASPLPVLLLTSPVYFVPTNNASIPCTFSPFLPFPLAADNPPCDLHFCDSVPVLVVWLVHFFFLSSVVDSCEFVVILLFIVFDLLFLR